MNRFVFLGAMIGNKWDWRHHNCWTFACHVERELFGRTLPSVSVPPDLSKRWVLQSFDGHPERAEWQEMPEGPGGLITAQDGALCLMAHLRMPGHIGVWLKPEGCIIHCDERAGVCFESPLALRQQGWRQLRFFEPKEKEMSSEMQEKNVALKTGSPVMTDSRAAMELLQVRVDALEAAVCDLQNQITVLASKQAD